MPTTVDLSELSAQNYRRHRLPRALVIIVLAGLVTLLLAVAWLVVVSQPGVSAGYVAVTILVVGMLVSLGAYSLRFWAVPPLSVAILENGLNFRTASGRTNLLTWDQDDLDVELLDRSKDSMTPACAAYRIWVRGSAWDRRLPWRHVIPLTYVTQEALTAILDSARQAGALVTANPSFNPISMGSLTDSSASAFMISTSPVIHRQPHYISQTKST